MAHLPALFSLEDSLAVAPVRRVRALPDGSTQQIGAMGLCAGAGALAGIGTMLQATVPVCRPHCGPVYPPALFFPLLKPRTDFIALACLSLLTVFGMPSHLNRKEKKLVYVSCENEQVSQALQPLGFP